MKRLLERIIKFIFHQLRNVLWLCQGKPLQVPSLTHATLDEDDLILARAWLKKPEQWYREDEVAAFEKQFASWNGSQYAFSFMGGRVALSAIIYAFDLQAGDEVILPGYTCVVVPNAFHYQGIKTIFADIELDTFGLDASRLVEKINANTKAILIHHLYGLVCRDYEELIAIARCHNLYVIEDCAHSTGAEYKDKKVGNLGDAAFYSCEQSKVFTTIQGGIAVTNDPQLAARLTVYAAGRNYPNPEKISRLLHSVLLNYYRHKHPKRWWWGELADILWGHKELASTTNMEERGERPPDYGERMPAPLAALGLNQLQKLDMYNECRRETAAKWDRWCLENGYQTPLIIPESKPIYLRYPILVEPEKKVDHTWAEEELDSELGVWFATHVHPVDWLVEDCPNADQAVRQCINLPGIISC